MATVTTSTTSHAVPSRYDWQLEAPPAFRRRVGAICLPLLPAALLATGPLDPFDDQAPVRKQLGQVGGHVHEVQVLGLVELLGALLGVAMVLTFAGLTRGRGRGLGNAGVAFGALGCLGMALVAVHHWVLGAVAGLPVGVGAHVMGRLDSLAGPEVLPMIVAMPIAMLLFGIAGFRAGFVPRPALVLLVLFFVGELVPGVPGGEAGPLVLALAALGWTGWVVAHLR